MALKLRALPSGPLETNAYLLFDKGRGEAILVDAPHFSWEGVQAALREEGCRLTDLLLTHGHYDHMGDAARVVRETGARTFGHAADRLMFETPEMMRPFVYPPDAPLEPVAIGRWVEDGDRLELLEQEAEVRHVPGHCPGNVLFYFAALKIAFVGDALFAGGVGRWDLIGGDFETLRSSIRRRIYTLPADVRVLPGHGPTTTVGAEMRSNPFVAAE